MGAHLLANRSLAALGIAPDPNRIGLDLVMAANPEKDPKQSLLSSLANSLTGMPVWDLVTGVFKLGKKVWYAYTMGSLYEVLEHESTLELLDTRGVMAHFKKRQKVRYLQDNIIAYQDQAWGDGQILLNYRCSPGRAVDFYRPGRKTFILIALHEQRSCGDIDEFNMEWDMRDGFLRENELWQTDINHPTRHLQIQIIFPKTRPPQRATLIEDTRRKAMTLDDRYQYRLADGRWKILWETDRVRTNESYTVQWEW